MIQQNKLNMYLRESRDVIPTPFNKTGKLSLLYVFSPCWMCILSHNWAQIQAMNFYLTEKSSFKIEKLGVFVSFFFLSIWFFFSGTPTKQYNTQYRISILIQGFRNFFFLRHCSFQLKSMKIPFKRTIWSLWKNYISMSF